jgi:hypothetical protein
MSIEATLLLEAGYEQALMGMASSYKNPGLSLQEWWTPETFAKAAKRAPKLAHMEGGHNKFLEHIEVWIWVVAERGWWQEADTYRLASKQSESTMHKLDKRPLVQADFGELIPEDYLIYLNELVATKQFFKLKKLLPEGYLQAREWKMSYKTLKNICHQRHKHRLPEWKMFVDQILSQIEHPELIGLD